MQFRALTLDDIQSFKEHFGALDSRTCDYTVGGMFLWRNYYKMECCSFEDFTAVRLYDGQGRAYYSLPLSRDVPAALRRFSELLKASGETDAAFTTIPEEYRDEVEALFCEPRTDEERDFADYLYAASDLVNLGGRKYGGQRNQISQFKRECGEWSFLPIDKENAGAVADFFIRISDLSSDANGTKVEEHAMILEVLSSLDAYGMLGGVLTVGERIVGFSFGEIIGDTLTVHIEKADRAVKGAYQMLNNSFARAYATDGVEYINREDDMGDIGLRIAKESYHPIKLLPKYTISGKLR